MKKLALLLALAWLAGCVPKDAIAPEYKGPDAATLFFFDNQMHVFGQYMEMDDEIITALSADARIVVMVAPGQHVMRLQPAVDGQSIPHKTNLQPETAHYYYFDRSSAGFVQIKEISKAAFDRRIEEAEDAKFKRRGK